MTRLLAVLTLFAAWITQADAGALHDAAKSGDISTATQLLNQGAPVNEIDPFRGTPLHAAVAGRHAEMVALLIDRGADVGAKEPSLGLTPLHLAALADQIAIVTLLLDSRADIEA